MSQEFLLINLDSGDMLFLGNQRTHPPVPEIGIAEGHSIFDEIPHYEYGGEEFRGSNPRSAWLADYIRKAGHKLNFFLSHSRGCRLIVMDTNDIFNLLAEFEEEYPDAIISLNGQDSPKSDYYERRLRNSKSLGLSTEEEKKSHAARELHYKNEIKEILRKNFKKDKEENARLLNIETGGLPPNPIFTPWDG
ncbi:hypothetical protein [Variovorax sp. YR266]|jgi:hypothetical protein|uniref:hypothetical protein n=1 Tax=Variovorax sp. YR266 TaxID=1884386 RepID=UPI00115F834D|nr:hypothetical protein [Variovorax sp. YR266]